MVFMYIRGTETQSHTFEGGRCWALDPDLQVPHSASLRGSSASAWSGLPLSQPALQGGDGDGDGVCEKVALVVSPAGRGPSWPGESVPISLAHKHRVTWFPAYSSAAVQFPHLYALSFGPPSARSW